MLPHLWNSLIASQPNPHVLQTWEWGQVKKQYGWEPLYLTWEDGGQFIVSKQVISPQKSISGSSRPQAAALLLQRLLPVRGFAAHMRLLYLPKGPCLDWSDTGLRERVLVDLYHLARRLGAIFIKIDPDVVLGRGIPSQPGSQEVPAGQAVVADLKKHGWAHSPEQVQFQNTVLVDLASSEEEILQRMKQKMRYNIHLARRKGVTVRSGDLGDLDLLYHMYAETSLRDGFVIRDPLYYRTVWSTFIERLGKAGEYENMDEIPIAEPLIAEVDGEPVSAVIIYRFSRRAWYLYGMSRQAHREKMPNHLLQWEAIHRAKAAGCLIYDLWGAPDQFDESDPLWGVHRFKEGLGGEVSRTIGAWDLPVCPVLHRIYTQTLPRLLAWMRRRGRLQTRQSIGT